MNQEQFYAINFVTIIQAKVYQNDLFHENSRKKCHISLRGIGLLQP